MKAFILGQLGTEWICSWIQLHNGSMLLAQKALQGCLQLLCGVIFSIKCHKFSLGVQQVHDDRVINEIIFVVIITCPSVVNPILPCCLFDLQSPPHYVFPKACISYFFWHQTAEALYIGPTTQPLHLDTGIDSCVHRAQNLQDKAMELT